MYTYQRAVGVYLSGPEGQQLLDISRIALKNIPVHFRQMIVVVLDGVYNQEVSLDLLTDYRNELIGNELTIQAWLDTKASTPLKTSNTLPGNEYRYVTCEDIQYRWFSLFPGDIRISDDRQDTLTSSSANDIRVRKTDNTLVDYQALQDRALWTVNGHLCRAIARDNDLFLINAGKHFRVYDNIHVTCLNFNTISTLNTYPIKEEEVEFEDHDTYGFLHLKTQIPLTDKTVWMSIGGRLYMADVINVTGRNSLAIRIDYVDWFSRIFDSKNYIDLSSVIDLERQVVSKDFFFTEMFFTSLLTDASSFLIVLDNPNLSVELVPITPYHFPFTYHTHETKKLPLMVSNGLLPKYYTRKIINRRLLDIDLGVNRLYLNKTTGEGNGGGLLHGFTNRKRPSVLHRGYLLKIRSIIQEA
ncbi:hypothetical protein NFI00_000050 [Salmonella enterica]|nr:hypothetical protein [Salmonella enterica subsp. enterica serovar Minnesota]EJI5696347.1 hypothetical protein [Salmonella enterica]